MPPHKSIRVPINDAPDPEKEGAIRTIGEFKGQKADYEFTLNGGERIHIIKYKDFYEVHWDKVSPQINIIEHLRQDAPHWWITLWALSGATTGALFYEKNRIAGAGIGASIGLLIGLLTAQF